MSRDLVIAFGTASVAILGGLLSRWDQTIRHYRAHPGSLLALGAAVLFLMFSIVTGAVVAGEDADPATIVFVIQSFGVTWGLGFLVVPPLFQLWEALGERWSERRMQFLALSLQVLTIVVPITYVAFIWPWWLFVLWLATSAVAVFIRAKLGPTVGAKAPPDAG